jgi:hypothetical protein
MKDKKETRKSYKDKKNEEEKKWDLGEFFLQIHKQMWNILGIKW